MLAQGLVVWTLCSIYLFSAQIPSAFSQTQKKLPDRTATELYPFTTDLDAEGKFVLRWGFNETIIRFQVQVQALGYVGFGISESEKMFPADVFVAYITDNLNNNLVYFKDYHTVGYSHPVPDAPGAQNWFLDHGYEENGWTVLEFHRDLDTCDPLGDRVITTDTMRLIYAYSDTDPADLDSVKYHQSKRGFKSVSLLTISPPPRFLPSVKTRDFLNDNYLIPTDQMTTFHCKVFDLSNVTKKHHIIKVSPVLSSTSGHTVDHMVLYRCHVKDPSTLMRSGESFNCFTDAPDHIQFCREHVASFGHGKSDMFLPKDVGIPYGGPGEANVYVLATHYENEEFTTGLVDNSGIKITYTSQLRQHDAGFLSLGNIISPNWLQFIPPGDPNFVQKAYCSRRCLAWGIGNCRRRRGKSVPMTVVGVQFHSHSLGKAMKLRHITRGRRNQARENPWLAFDQSYDSHHQNFRLLKRRGTVACNDELLLECTYDSTKTTDPTVGGWTDHDEICRAYVLYYPRKPIEGCMSWSNYDQFYNSTGHKVEGGDVFRTLVSTNWSTDRTMRRNLRYSLDNSRENGQCWSSSPRRRIPYGIDFFRQPILTRPYSEPPSAVCARAK